MNNTKTNQTKALWVKQVEIQAEINRLEAMIQDVNHPMQTGHSEFWKANDRKIVGRIRARHNNTNKIIALCGEFDREYWKSIRPAGCRNASGLLIN